MARGRVVRRTKSGSYEGYSKASTRARRGKAARRTTKAEHRALNTLKHRNKSRAHARRKSR